MIVAEILFGAAFTGLTSLALGFLIVQALKLRLHRGELAPFAFLLGSAALSTIVFLLMSVWLGRVWCFALTGCAAIAACWHRRAWRASTTHAEHSLSPYWRWMFAAGLVVYGTFTFVHAMAPETSPDGVAYHLGTVGRYFREGGFAWHTTNMYAHLPMGVEMLFLFAFSFGRHSAAALVHWQFLLVLPFLVYACGRRAGHPKAGAVAGLLTFISPVVAIDGASAYVDVATAAVAFGMFSLLLVWEQERDREYLIAIGTLAGFSYACKMTAAPAIPLALGFVTWTLWRKRELSWRPLAAVTAAAFAMVLPWLVKNSLMAGNPFSPFMNREFPNPYVRISFEDLYRAMYRTYYGKITSPAQIPLEVTVGGGILNGMIGPVFLLAPVALLALRWPLGRRLCMGGLLFLTLYPNNIGTRFLITALPFLALAMSLTLERWRGVCTAAALFHAYMSWPGVIPAYADPFVWRLDGFLWRAATRQEAEEDYLTRQIQAYKMARLVDKLVPDGGRVFTFGGVSEAYTRHDIVVAYQGGFNNAAGDILAGGLVPEGHASKSILFRFPPREVRRVRLVQTANTRQIWSVSELRVMASPTVEQPREQWWRIRASPNPWDVQWAFDNCPITRWKAWESARPGQFVEIDFVRPLEIAGLRADVPLDQPATRARVEWQLPGGQWESPAVEAEMLDLETPKNLRRMAARNLKQLGFTHLVVAQDEFLASDVARNMTAWGLTLLGDTGHSRLYKLN